MRGEDVVIVETLWGLCGIKALSRNRVGDTIARAAFQRVSDGQGG